MTAAPSSPTTRASGAAAARTRSAGPTAAIRSSRISIDLADPAPATIVTMPASVSSTSTVQPSTDRAGSGVVRAGTGRMPEPAASRRTFTPETYCQLDGVQQRTA